MSHRDEQNERISSIQAVGNGIAVSPPLAVSCRNEEKDNDEGQ